jgi:hypothetical protein
MRWSSAWSRSLRASATVAGRLPELVRRDPRPGAVLRPRAARARLRAAVAARGLARQSLRGSGTISRSSCRASTCSRIPPNARARRHLLEAASCGVAVVAAGVGGVLDVIEHGHRARSARRRTRIRRRFARLLSIRSSGPPGAAARADMQRRFSIQAMVSAHLDLYAAVLHEPVAEAARRAIARGPRRLHVIDDSDLEAAALRSVARCSSAVRESRPPSRAPGAGSRRRSPTFRELAVVRERHRRVLELGQGRAARRSERADHGARRSLEPVVRAMAEGARAQLGVDLAVP